MSTQHTFRVRPIFHQTTISNTFISRISVLQLQNILDLLPQIKANVCIPRRISQLVFLLLYQSCKPVCANLYGKSHTRVLAKINACPITFQTIEVSAPHPTHIRKIRSALIASTTTRRTLSGSTVVVVSTFNPLGKAEEPVICGRHNKEGAESWKLRGCWWFW